VDLNAIYVKNRDPSAYTNKQALDTERLTLLVKKSNSGYMNDTEIHPHDLLSESIKAEYKKKILNQGILIDLDKDDQFEILYKYYELLLKFISNLDDMYFKINGYQED
jgi:biopolymer transport protein ExbD